MDIDTLVEHKEDLQLEIADAVAPLILGFKKTTGFSPRCIEIEMIDVTSPLDSRPDFILGPVKISLATGIGLE